MLGPLPTPAPDACAALPVSDESRAAGTARAIRFEFTDGGVFRRVTVTLDERRRALGLGAVAQRVASSPARPARDEFEFAQVTFGAAGEVVRGVHQRVVDGVPEGQPHGPRPLWAGDTVQARALAAAVRDRCAR